MGIPQSWLCAVLAQLVERRSPKPGVTGSTPVDRATQGVRTTEVQQTLTLLMVVRLRHALPDIEVFHENNSSSKHNPVGRILYVVCACDNRFFC